MSTIEGLSIVRRDWKPAGAKKGRRPIYGWTLHRNDCRYVTRSSEARPAPADPYPGTVDCQACKPSSGSHRTTYTDLPSGRVAATCAGCDITAESTNREGARVMMVRRHANAAKEIA